ncbi:MAG UNVERIFIED_CONTAM: DUF4401 domain-containing protein [Anaerolineae bacterium]
MIALRPIVRPVSYALAVGMLGALVFETILGDPSLFRTGLTDSRTSLVYPIISAVTLTLITLWLVMRWLNEHQHPLFSRLGVAIIALLGVLSIPSAFTPGIMAGILLILLGFRNRNAVLSGLAYAFLSGFVIYFYYDLQTTLLVKSLILMVSGLLLWAVACSSQRLSRRKPHEPHPTSYRDWGNARVLFVPRQHGHLSSGTHLVTGRNRLLGAGTR